MGNWHLVNLKAFSSSEGSFVILGINTVCVTAGSEGTVDFDVEVALAFLKPSSLALALALAFCAAVSKQSQRPPS